MPLFDVGEDVLNTMSESLDTFRLLGHHALLQTKNEMRQFETFSQWLIIQIQLLTTEAGSATANELGGKAAAMDHARLLDYITDVLTQSRVNLFLGEKTDTIIEASCNSGHDLPRSKVIKELGQNIQNIIGTNKSGHISLNFLYQALTLHKLASAMIDNVSRRFTSDIDILRNIVLESEGMTDEIAVHMISEVDLLVHFVSCCLAAFTNKCVG